MALIIVLGALVVCGAGGVVAYLYLPGSWEVLERKLVARTPIYVLVNRRGDQITVYREIWWRDMATGEKVSSGTDSMLDTWERKEMFLADLADREAE